MTSQGETGGTRLKPPVEAVRSHYDKSNEFFKLWLDPSMTYSCAYFEERPNMTREEAQYAKRKLALDKLNLEPGMTLLDIGCGWGSTMRHAVAEYDVNVIGLTLSENQYAHDKQKFEELDSPRRKEVRIQGWEEFDEPIDRIVSLGAFEHFADGAGDAGFKVERYHRIGSNYVPTLNAWADALEANKEKAIELQGQKVYDTYMHYLRGCSDLFRDHYTDVCQFTLVK